MFLTHKIAKPYSPPPQRARLGEGLGDDLIRPLLHPPPKGEEAWDY
jgi:hypothetical protein